MKGFLIISLIVLCGCGKRGETRHTKTSDFLIPKVTPVKLKSPLCECKSCKCDGCVCGTITEQPKNPKVVPIPDNPVTTDTDPLRTLLAPQRPVPPVYQAPAAQDCPSGMCFRPNTDTTEATASQSGSSYEQPRRRGIFGLRGRRGR